MSNLPTDYSKVKVVMPVRAVKKPEPAPQASANSEQPSTSGAPSTPSLDATMRQGAQTGTLALLIYVYVPTCGTEGSSLVQLKSLKA